MKKLILAAIAVASVSSAPAQAADFIFCYEAAGSCVATGSFSFSDGKSGELGFDDLSSFSVSLFGQSYNLADALGLTNYQYFAYDTASNAFLTRTLNGTQGTFSSSLSALNDAADEGFFFNGAPGSYTEYSTSQQGTFDSISISAVSAAVPEPATWALLMIGFAAMGSAVRTGRQKQKLSLFYS